MTGFFSNLMLALVWCALGGAFTGLNFLTGFIIGFLVLLVVQVKVPSISGYAQRLLRLISFSGFFLREMIKANLRVAYDVITPTWYMKPGVIAVPLLAKTDIEVLFVTSLISLTPGTLVIDVSDDRRVLFIHAMFLQDEDELRDDLLDLEQRVLGILR